MTRCRRAALLLAAAILSGCQTGPPAAPGPAASVIAGDWPASWTAAGRLAVRDTGSGFSARFQWHETPTLSLIDVHGPLGIGAVRVSCTADAIRIDNGHDTQTIPAPFDTLEAALSERLGAALPLRTLRYWLLGRPDPASAVDSGEAGQFVQYGWTVSAQPFGPAPAGGHALPHELTVERAPTRIRIVIERWTLDGAGVAR